jgi:hypothetical protein
LWVMIIIFLVMVSIGSKIAVRKAEVSKDLSQSCNNMNPTSLLASIDDVAYRAEKLLCSKDCPCMMTRI